MSDYELDYDEYDYDSEEDEFEAYEREYQEGKRDIIHIKYIADGCETIKEVSAVLRGYADELDALDDKGFVLVEPIDNSHGELVKK